MTVCTACAEDQHERCNRAAEIPSFGGPIIRDCECALREHAVLPYAGTEGYSNSRASQDRAIEEARSGSAGDRQGMILGQLRALGWAGGTWREIGDVLGYHHGQTTGTLSALHKAGSIARLTERRGRSSVYVLIDFVGTREVEPHGRKAPVDSLRDPLTDALLDDAENRDGWLSDSLYPAQVARDEQRVYIQGTIDIHHLVSIVLKTLEQT